MRFESLLLCPESWDMNERTGGYPKSQSAPAALVTEEARPVERVKERRGAAIR